MCHDDDWVNLAVADDSLVVNLLLRLRRTPPLPPPPPSLHLHWTVRQRRSRSARRHAAAASHKKQDSTRASPTTPLSWSGATSASGGNLDGYEESSRLTTLPQTSRSKVHSLLLLLLLLFCVSLFRHARGPHVSELNGFFCFCVCLSVTVAICVYVYACWCGGFSWILEWTKMPLTRISPTPDLEFYICYFYFHFVTIEFL